MAGEVGRLVANISLLYAKFKSEDYEQNQRGYFKRHLEHIK
jgi:hypothetical protein